MNIPETKKIQPRETSYIIPGAPIPLARARHGGLHNKCWDTQKQIKNAFGIQLSNIHSARPLFQGPVHIKIDFFLQMPFKRAPNLPNSLHPYRPDLDNLIKFVLDVANGVLWKDDSIVASIIAAKRYGEQPRTELTVVEMR